MGGSSVSVRWRLGAGLAALGLVAAACGGGDDEATDDTVALEEIEPIVAIDPCELIDEPTASSLAGADVGEAESTTEDDGTTTCDFPFADEDVADDTGSAIAASLQIGPGDEDDVPSGSALARSLDMGDAAGVETPDDTKVRVVYVVQTVVVRVEVVPADGEVSEELIDEVVEFTETTEAPVTEAVTGEPFVPDETTTTFVDEEVPEGEEIEVDGAPQTLEVERAGGIDNRVFEAEEGDVIFVRVTGATRNPADATDCLAVLVRDPTDFTIGSTSALDDGTAFIDRLELELDGVYQVELDPGASSTGTVDVEITSATDEEGTVSVDGPEVEASVEQAGAISRFTFSASAGDAIFVSVPAASRQPVDATDCLTVLVRDPTEFTVGSTCAQDDGSAFIDRIELTVSGRYSLELDPGGPMLGTVSMAITSAD